MADDTQLVALCCLAGAGSDVTVEEVQLLVDLAGRIGMDRASFLDHVGKFEDDDEFRAEQTDLVARDVEGTFHELVRRARVGNPVDEGRLQMALWRAATKLDLDAERLATLIQPAG